jgi:outer membrane murein-binding lipoprotein Lpp
MDGIVSDQRKRLKMNNKIMTVAAVLLVAGAISGCFSFKGGDETVIQQKSTTTERELQDLKAAYDKGIISQQEYNQQRDRLLGK